MKKKVIYGGIINWNDTLSFVGQPYVKRCFEILRQQILCCFESQGFRIETYTDSQDSKQHVISLFRPVAASANKCEFGLHSVSNKCNFQSNKTVKFLTALICWKKCLLNSVMHGKSVFSYLRVGITIYRWLAIRDFFSVASVRAIMARLDHGKAGSISGRWPISHALR